MPWKMESDEKPEDFERTSGQVKPPAQEPSTSRGVYERPPIPQACLYGSTGGSLPCAQSWHPTSRLVHGPCAHPSARLQPSHSAWTRPCTPRTVAVPAAGYMGIARPQAARPCPGQVVVVRELSPARPVACLAHASPRAVSPVIRSVPTAPMHPVIPVPAPQGQMSPPVLRQRSLSPVMRMPGSTPACPSQIPVRQPTPRTQSAQLGPFAGCVTSTSPRRERSLSPVGLPPVPVLSGLGAAAAPETSSAQKCLSPRTVIIRNATPRAPAGHKVQSPVQVLVTPRAVPQGKGTATPGGILEGLRAVPSVPRTILHPHAGKVLVQRAASHGAVKVARAGPAVLPPRRPASGLVKEPLSEQLTAAGQLPPRGTVMHANMEQFFAEGEKQDAYFLAFNAALSEVGAVEATCQKLLARLHSGPCVRWEEMVSLNPVVHILATGQSVQEQAAGTECQGWWRSLLARHGLFGPGNAMGTPELSELVTDALRFLRDRHAPEAFLRNLRTVHSGSKRLKELYGSFEFHARGMMGKSYRCRSRLTREEHICRQVCKDKVSAPSDLIRAEVEMLRSLEHPSVPQVIASFEDFNNIYIVLEPVESIELVNILQQWHQNGQGLSVGWLAEIARQLLEALRHCHEMRPRSLVHGDLRLTSLLLSAVTDARTAPQLILADWGLAGLPIPPPALRSRADSDGPAAASPSRLEDWLQSPSTLLDVWSCGCLLFILLSGCHPFNGDPGGRLVPSAVVGLHGSVPPEPDWRLLPSASSTSLCAQMLSWDVKARPSAAECLRHSWLSAEDADSTALPMEALGNLLKAHHKSKLQEITAGLAISEQIASPFSAVGAALAVKRAFEDLAGDAAGGSNQEFSAPTVTSPAASGVLEKLGMSEKGIEKVIKAFSDEAGAVNYQLLTSHCTELAEDLLDHALWRVFTAAGEDHRGILGAAELEKALAESAGEGGGADRAGGGEPDSQGPFGSEMKASDIVRQVACGRQQVTFEELRAAVILRQSISQADA